MIVSELEKNSIRIWFVAVVDMGVKEDLKIVK